MLLQPKEITINYEDEELKFNIGKFPATVGREIISKYPIANLPKLGDYAISEDTMLKLMQYVERVYPDRVQVLANKALIDNHIPSWEVLLDIELKAIEYNCSFFHNGKALEFIEYLGTQLNKYVAPEIKKLLPELAFLFDKNSKGAVLNKETKGVQ